MRLGRRLGQILPIVHYESAASTRNSRVLPFHPKCPVPLTVLRENVALASLAAAPLVVPYLERLNGPLLPEQKAMLASVLCRTTHQPHGRSPTCPRARPA